METLPSVDQSLFLAINHLPHSFFSDFLALLISGVGTAGVIWLILSLIVFFKEEKKHPLFWMHMGSVVVSSWLLVELLLKYLFARHRPTEAMGAIIVGSGASWYSFPSSHAAVAWASYLILSHYEPRWKPFLFVLALLISFSRIYLGVHYPLDVIVGGLVGWSIGTIVLSFAGEKGSHPSKTSKRVKKYRRK